MKLHFGLVVVALSTIGCATETLDTGETAQAGTIRCPNPEECTQTNGGGVYTQELGNAHIGSTDMMLTHFINLGDAVGFDAREWDDAVSGYRVVTGQIDHAIYNGLTYSVWSIDETLTVPKIQLHRMVNGFNDDPAPTGTALLDLQLILYMKPRSPWTLSFRLGHNHMVNDLGVSDGQLSQGPGSQHVTVQAFDMFWNDGETLTSNPEPYCRLAKKVVGSTEIPPTDPVVFQQGIGVNAVTAVMTPTSSYVTLSCLHGAIVTARWWGYFYRGTTAQTNMFEAAMHMKRASYCGDDTFFTRRNTDITIRDSLNLSDSQHNLNESIDPTTFEASWGLVGNSIRARCVNMGKRRKPLAKYPPVSGATFDGHTCADGTVIPDCPPDPNLYPPILNGSAGYYGPLADQRVL